MNEPTTTMILITASMLYDLVSCCHRVTMDIFADPEDREDVSPFVHLLRERALRMRIRLDKATKRLPFPTTIPGQASRG